MGLTENNFTAAEMVAFYLSEVLRVPEVGRDPERALRLHRALEANAENWKEACKWARGTRLGVILGNFKRHGWNWSEKESAYRQLLHGLEQFGQQEGRQQMVGEIDGKQPFEVLREWRKEKFA